MDSATVKIVKERKLLTIRIIEIMEIIKIIKIIKLDEWAVRAYSDDKGGGWVGGGFGRKASAWVRREGHEARV
jgi:hypothetical protein